MGTSNAKLLKHRFFLRRNSHFSLRQQAPNVMRTMHLLHLRQGRQRQSHVETDTCAAEELEQHQRVEEWNKKNEQNNPPIYG